MLTKTLTAVLALASIATCTAMTATAAPASGSADLDDFSSNPAYAKYYTQQLSWSKDIPGCWQLADIAPTECALVTAPRDWQDPSKGDLKFAIGRVAGDERRGRRILFSNPGGPGGIGHVQSVAMKHGLGLDDHMGIGVDPRGVGMSTQLECPPLEIAKDGVDADGDSRDFTEAQVRASEKQQADYYKKCAEQPDTLLPYMGTLQVARDFNLVRILFGAPTADYIGISYGTWLGATMRRAFPSKFDRVVLDSAWDITLPYMETAYKGQTQGFSIGFDRAFLPFVSRHHDMYKLGTTTAQAAQSVERIRALVAKNHAHLTPDQFDTSIRARLYRLVRMDAIARFIIAVGITYGDPAVSGVMTPEEAKKIVDTQKTLTMKDEVPFAASVICGDSPNPTDYFERYQSLFRSLPLSEYSPYDLCAGWPYKPAMDRDFLKRPVGKVLMIHNEVDPATPWNGARNAWKKNPEAKMLFLSNSYGHTVFHYPQIQSHMIHYLKTGELPAKDVRLLGLPIAAGPIKENAVYEMQHPTSPSDPFPKPYFYVERDLSDPPIDAEATAAAQKPGTARAGTTSTLSPAQQALLDKLADETR